MQEGNSRMLRKTFSATVRTFIVDQIGIVEVIGVAFSAFLSNFYTW